VQGSRLCVRDEGNCSSSFPHAVQIINAINHSVATSWFSSLRLYNDARTNIHQIFKFFLRLSTKTAYVHCDGDFVCSQSKTPVSYDEGCFEVGHMGGGI